MHVFKQGVDAWARRCRRAGTLVLTSAPKLSHWDGPWQISSASRRIDDRISVTSSPRIPLMTGRSSIKPYSVLRSRSIDWADACATRRRDKRC